MKGDEYTEQSTVIMSVIGTLVLVIVGYLFFGNQQQTNPTMLK